MKFVLTEDEIKEALSQYLQDYKTNIFGYNKLNINFHQSGLKIEHPLVAEITISEEKTYE